MGTLTIRQLDDKIKARLRVQAARHGRSMEQEAREILRAALSKARASSEEGLFQAIRRRIEPLGGVELELPPRDPIRQLPDFEE